MTTKQDWIGRTGKSWASEWKRTDRSFSGLTDCILDRTREVSFRNVVDIGCGAGELSLALARMHHEIDVLGMDISDELIAIARARAQKLSNVSFEVGDASTWSATDCRPDLYISRHGVMFFADPVAAFASLRKQAAPEAQLIFSCFAAKEDNVWADRIQGFLPSGLVQQSDPTAPGPFAFSDRSRVQGILQDAGWANVKITPCDYAYIAGAGNDPVEDAIDFFQKIGPAASAISKLSPQQTARFLAKLRAYLSANLEDGIVALRAAAWIVSANLP